MDKEKRIKRNAKDVRYKRKNAENVVKARRQNKMELIAYKGGKCSRCGYCKPFPSAYHFHHKDASNKKFTVSRFMSRKLETLKKEVDKCELLCSNCHAEHHDRIKVKHMENTIESIKNLSDVELEKRAERQRKKATGYLCIFCKKKYLPNHKEQMYCSPQCGHLSRRKTDRPSKEKLNEMIKTKTWSEIGRIYGVSDNAVRKWLSSK